MALDIGGHGADSFVPVQVAQANWGHEPDGYDPRGVADAYLRHATSDVSATATAFRTPADV